MMMVTRIIRHRHVELEPNLKLGFRPSAGPPVTVGMGPSRPGLADPPGLSFRSRRRRLRWRLWQLNSRSPPPRRPLRPAGVTSSRRPTEVQPSSTLHIITASHEASYLFILNVEQAKNLNFFVFLQNACKTPASVFVYRSCLWALCQSSECDVCSFA